MRSIGFLLLATTPNIFMFEGGAKSKKPKIVKQFGFYFRNSELYGIMRPAIAGRILPKVFHWDHEPHIVGRTTPKRVFGS